MVWVYVFGLTNFTVEVDAKYIKGMINNPDLQPNTTIDHWIAGILLFSFKLMHVPTEKHASPDGLSHCLQSELDLPEDDDHEDWLDHFYSFSTEAVNDCLPPTSLSNHDHHSLPPPSYHLASLPPPASFYLAFSVTADADNTPDISDDPAILQSAKAHAWEEKIEMIHAFLMSCVQPPDLTNAQYSSFLNSASCFFLLDGNLWHREPHGWHQLVVDESKWYHLIKEVHDDLGHKGVFMVHTHLLLRFWWPLLVKDLKWYVCTCHECQIQQMQKLHIPPTVPMIRGLFHKAHIDMMLMPKAGGYHYIVQARCALTSYPEWCMLCAENSTMLMSFIFKDILCCWGPLAEIVMDNGPTFIQALDAPAMQYHIHHICISPYNSQANGIIEHCHYEVCEAIMKSSSHHSEVHEFISFMVHSVELLFPFDLAEATFLLPLSHKDVSLLTTTELIAWHVHQLQKHQDDLDQVHDNILCTCFQSIQQFKDTFLHCIKDYNFTPGTLMLVHNSHVEKELNWKMKPGTLAPWSSFIRPLGAQYLLAELDGSISKLCFAEFCLLPYHPWSQTHTTITCTTGLDDKELDQLLEEAEDDPTNDEVEAFASDS
ncbi:hypothetical protein M404DRAFT_26133 [Pisolithus tinctorius Marx 270]|uniref:Integrase catalytic domain-containing protein n=1 Tax=Pisolithus tinctorius Marx 270 TaxID=870435 RepID=A0A0C3K509_PISTI|nr:hypothetical protein M404DRAFT_26133 [Pisolithus tinctorius Marx 270]